MGGHGPRSIGPGEARTRARAARRLPGVGCGVRFGNPRPPGELHFGKPGRLVDTGRAMNSKLSLFVVAGALAAGLSFARPARQERDPMDRIEDLEKEVVALKTELAALRKAPAQATSAPAQDVALRQDVEQVVRWIQSQSQGADALTRALEEARAKGFTAGINPDSRSVLLAGFGELTRSLKAPLALSKPESKSEDAKSNARGAKH